mmetsp:Transcript_23107/g.48338  ORF Transcript_23107/g.48338 Transcript_23107/m.48338 type:complete len:219 (-) Transcript_23107:88-744(-)
MTFVGVDIGPTWITHKPPSNEIDIKLERIKKGECAECGMKTHNIAKMSNTRKPLTNDSVLDGRCLVCKPIVVGTAIIPTSPGSLNENNSGNEIKIHTNTDEETELGSGEYGGGLNGKNNAEMNSVLPNDSNSVLESSPYNNESPTQNDSKCNSSCVRRHPKKTVFSCAVIIVVIVVVSIFSGIIAAPYDDYDDDFVLPDDDDDFVLPYNYYFQYDDNY